MASTAKPYTPPTERITVQFLTDQYFSEYSKHRFRKGDLLEVTPDVAERWYRLNVALPLGDPAQD